MVAEKVNGIFLDDRILLDNCDLARDFYNKSRYGHVLKDGSVQVSLIEGLYLLEKGKIEVFDKRKKVYDAERYIKKASKVEKFFGTRYSVFSNLRSRGYIVKTALKFGADFRVYDRGVKPGEDHAKWIVYPVNEANVLTWYEFAAKNRVAHSTKKRLLMGIVDEESDVTYYEIKWMRP